MPANYAFWHEKIWTRPQISPFALKLYPAKKKICMYGMQNINNPLPSPSIFFLFILSSSLPSRSKRLPRATTLLFSFVFLYMYNIAKGPNSCQNSLFLFMSYLKSHSWRPHTRTDLTYWAFEKMLIAHLSLLLKPSDTVLCSQKGKKKGTRW